MCPIAAERSGAISRASSRLHPVRSAHEQIVGEEVPQARERMTHRRLRKTDAASSAGDGALAHQRVEGFEQVEVDGTNIHGENGYHIINLFDRWRCTHLITSETKSLGGKA